MYAIRPAEASINPAAQRSYLSVDIIATPPPLVDSAGNLLAFETPQILKVAGETLAALLTPRPL